MPTEILRKYNADPADVFEHLHKLCKQNDLRVTEINRSINRIKLSTPLSLFSWGENYTLFLNSNENTTQILIEGSPKFIANITGHTKANTIIQAIVKELDRIFH